MSDAFGVESNNFFFRALPRSLVIEEFFPMSAGTSSFIRENFRSCVSVSLFHIGWFSFLHLFIHFLYRQMRCAVRFKPNCNTSFVFIDFWQLSLLSWNDSKLRFDNEESNLRYQPSWKRNSALLFPPKQFFGLTSFVRYTTPLILQLPPSPA